MTSYVITLGFTGFILQQALSQHVSAEASYYILICLRVVFGLGISGIVPAIQTYLVLHGDPNKRSSTIASIGASFSIGMILGPALASFASSISLTAPFYLIAVFAVLLFFLVFFIVKDTTHVKVMTKPKAINWFKHPALPFLMMSTLVILGITGIQQIMGFLLQDRFGWNAVETTTQLGYAMMVMSLMSILVQMVLVPRFELGPTRLIYLGVFFALVTQICFITMPSYFGVVLAMGLFGICSGFLFPGVITAQTILAKNEEQSRLASVNASLQGLGGASGPILMASLYQVNAVIPFVFLGVAYLILFVAFLYFKVRIHHKAA
jgi:MFS family permease